MSKLLISALVLVLAPLAAFAECSRGHQQVMSCSDGMVWDAESQSCVHQVSG